jgi:hypothetical protein
MDFGPWAFLFLQGNAIMTGTYAAAFAHFV